jgi:hypothetical protein
LDGIVSERSQSSSALSCETTTMSEAGEHPGGGHMVERRRGVETQAVESAAGVLQASALAGVVPKGVAVKAGLLRPSGGDVPRLRFRGATASLP